MLSFVTLAVGLQAGRPALRAPRPLRASRAGVCVVMSGKVVVTDGTDSFYGSRTIFQMLHDYGDYSAIVVRARAPRVAHGRTAHAVVPPRRRRARLCPTPRRCCCRAPQGTAD